MKQMTPLGAEIGTISFFGLFLFHLLLNKRIQIQILLRLFLISDKFFFGRGRFPFVHMFISRNRKSWLPGSVGRARAPTGNRKVASSMLQSVISLCPWQRH